MPAVLKTAVPQGTESSNLSASAILYEAYMIPEEHKQAVITAGIQFIRAITESYGSEDGMKLWNSITETLDPSVKGEIFFAIMTGEYQNTIHIHGITTRDNFKKVSAIKELRDLTGVGLIGAKCLIAEVEAGRSIDVKCKPEQRLGAIRMFEWCGLKVQ